MKQYGKQSELLNKMMIRPKPMDRERYNDASSRFGDNSPGKSSNRNRLNSKRNSSILQGGANIMKADMLSPLTVLDSSYEGSLSSPMKKRKKVQWRNESDYMNQLTKGNKLSKDASALKAHEASFNLNYGERDGKNVINTAEYQRNLIHIALFK